MQAHRRKRRPSFWKSFAPANRLLSVSARCSCFARLKSRSVGAVFATYLRPVSIVIVASFETALILVGTTVSTTGQKKGVQIVQLSGTNRARTCDLMRVKQVPMSYRKPLNSAEEYLLLPESFAGR